MGKAILVLGVERTGTRLVTEIIVSGGAFGDATHEQRIDKALRGEKTIPPETKLIVLRRSYPHNGTYPDIKDLQHRLKTIGYEVTNIVITMRDYHFVVDSQKRGDAILPYPSWMSKSKVTREEFVMESSKRLFEQISKTETPFIFISYEALVLYPITLQKKIQETLNLPRKPNVKVMNGNRKYVT